MFCVRIVYGVYGIVIMYDNCQSCMFVLSYGTVLKLEPFIFLKQPCPSANVHWSSRQIAYSRHVATLQKVLLPRHSEVFVEYTGWAKKSGQFLKVR